MFPSPSPSAQAAPLPPLPELTTASQAASQQPDSGFAAILAGITPVKSGVDAINAACRQIVQSGAIPGAEQICAQIIALANQLTPMAVQQAMGGSSPVAPGGPAPVQQG